MENREFSEKKTEKEFYLDSAMMRILSSRPPPGVGVKNIIIWKNTVKREAEHKQGGN